MIVLFANSNGADNNMNAKNNSVKITGYNFFSSSLTSILYAFSDIRVNTNTAGINKIGNKGLYPTIFPKTTESIIVATGVQNANAILI